MDTVCNYIKDDIDDRDKLLASSDRQYLVESEIVRTMDYSHQMSPVKNQGKLGSCVAFAVTALKEWQEKKEDVFEKYILNKRKGNLDKKEYDYSEQWLYYNCKKIDPWKNSEGTSIRYAMKVLNKIGVPVEAGWVYNDIEKGKPESWAQLVARWNRVDSYIRVRNLMELKNALLRTPVPIGVPTYKAFTNPGSNGIINMPDPGEHYTGGHAICAVGFDDSKKLIKFKNSWSTKWGEDGYGYLHYDYINQYLWDAWYAKDLRVTKDMLKGKVTL